MPVRHGDPDLLGHTVLAHRPVMRTLFSSTREYVFEIINEIIQIRYKKKSNEGDFFFVIVGANFAQV